jgi:DNA-binding MarR family transcriptional regulator
MAIKGEDLTDREMLLLEILDMRENTSISEIAALCPKVSNATISTTITKLWRDKKLVNKLILPHNQRVTTVTLTPKGKKVLRKIRETQSNLYETITTSLALSLEQEALFKQALENAIKYFDEELQLKTA